MTDDDRIREALRGIAEEGEVPDEVGGWDAVRARAATGRRRRWVGGAGAGVVAVAAALLVAFVVVGVGDDDGGREDVAAGPGTTEAVTAPPTTGDDPTPVTFDGVPEHPLVVVSPDGRELVLYDGVTGARGRTLVEVGEDEVIEDPHLSAEGRVLYVVQSTDGPRIGGVLLDGTTSAADPMIAGAGTSPTEHDGFVAYVPSGGETIRIVDGAGRDAAPVIVDDLDLPPITTVEWSPAGDRLLVLAGHQLLVVPADATALSDGAVVAEVDSPAWQDPDRVLAVLDGRAVVVEAATGTVADLVPAPGDVVAVARAHETYFVDADSGVWRDDQPLGIEASAIAVPPPATGTTTDDPPPSVRGAVLVITTEGNLQRLDPVTGALTVVAEASGRDSAFVDVTRAGGTAVVALGAGEGSRPQLVEVALDTGEEDARGFGDHPALSPDGTTLAYVDGEPGTHQGVVVRTIATGEQRRIPAYETPFGTVLSQLEWSPDGERLLVVDRYENTVTWVVDPDRATYVSDGTPIAGEHGAATWLPGGTVASQVQCCYADTPGQPARIVVSDPDTGAELRELHDGTGLALLRDIAALNDGRVLGITVDGDLVEITTGSGVRTIASGFVAVDT